MPVPLLVLALAVLSAAGAVVAAGAAGTLVRLRPAVVLADGPADPLHVMSVIHGVMFAGWIVAAAFAFGVPAAFVLAAAGLLVQAVPIARFFARRLGVGAFGRLSLIAEAVATVGAVIAYAGLAG